jgi:Fis family transcriptional regulator
MPKQLKEKLVNTEEKPLGECARTAIDTFFKHLDGQPVTNLYDMVMLEVERPLLTAVMEHTGDNQSKASELLGINRGTLRKKLKQHNLL